MRRPGGIQAAQDQGTKESGIDAAILSTACPPTQLLRISASHLARDRLLDLALCCLIEARRRRPSVLLDEAAISIAVDRLEDVAEGAR
ncbi:MAG TPA: hypothetical protein VLE23_08370 [Geminicoccaceae bacterium]|nr:hypothetical protein [Geminicoccaceae bacterium]